MKDIYSQDFLYHFKNQPYKKELHGSTVRGKSANIYCGDDIEVGLRIIDGKINDIGYKTDGCVVSQGAMSVLAEYMIGKKIEEVNNLTRDTFVKMLGVKLTPIREKCALVGYNSVAKALKNELK